MTADLICDCLGVSAPVPPTILSPVPRSDRNLTTIPPKRAALLVGDCRPGGLRYR